MANESKLDHVLDAALVIADREGLDNVSMRRVAAELGVTAMALYRHVADKEQLLDLTADRAMRDLPEVGSHETWDVDVEEFFVALYDLGVAHPAVAEVMIHRPINGPNATASGNAIIDVLIQAGFADADAVDALVTLLVYSVGASLYHLSRASPATAPAAAEQTAPTAYRLRGTLAEAGDRPRFVANLRRIIASFATSADSRRRHSPSRNRRSASGGR